MCFGRNWRLHIDLRLACSLRGMQLPACAATEAPGRSSAVSYVDGRQKVLTYICREECEQTQLQYTKKVLSGLHCRAMGGRVVLDAVVSCSTPVDSSVCDKIN